MPITLVEITKLENKIKILHRRDAQGNSTGEFSDLSDRIGTLKGIVDNPSQTESQANRLELNKIHLKILELKIAQLKQASTDLSSRIDRLNNGPPGDEKNSEIAECTQTIALISKETAQFETEKIMRKNHLKM